MSKPPQMPKEIEELLGPIRAEVLELGLVRDLYVQLFIYADEDEGGMGE